MSGEGSPFGRLREDPRARAVAACVALILVALVVFDLVFLAHGTYRGVKFDQAAYYGRSHALLDLWRRSAPALAPLVPPASADWPEVGLDWAPVVRAMTTQGPAYPIFLALTQAVLGTGPERVRLAQVLLHAATALLVFLVARRLASPGVGLLALALFALYAPFTVMASQLLTETLCVFLLALAAWLGLGLAREGPAANGRRSLWAAPLLGLTLVALALTRPSLFPLSGLLLAGVAGWLLARFRRDRAGPLAVAAALLLAAYLAPYLAWQTTMSRAVRPGTFYLMVSGPRSPDTDLRESYDVPNGGWPRPLLFTARHGQSRFAPPPGESIARHPFASLVLRAEKAYRLWHAPATTYANPFGLPGWFTDGLHVLLVVGGACGLLFLRRGPPFWFLGLPVLYTSAAYVAYYPEERRFAFVAMPCVIVLCALALPPLAAALRRALGGEHRRRARLGLGAWLAAVGLGAAWLGAFPGAAAPGVPAAAAYGAAVALLTAALLAAAAWVAWRVVPEPAPAVRWGTLVGLAVLLAVPVGAHLGKYRDGSTWSVALADPDQAALQVFRLPPGLVPGRVAAARLLLDVRDGDGRVDDLEVSVNGRVQGDRVRAGEMHRDLRLAAEDFAPLLRGLDWERLEVVPGMRQWLAYRLDPALLANGTVAVAVRPTAVPGPSGPTRLYGDAAWGDPHDYRGPRPWLDPEVNRRLRHLRFGGRESLYRYETYGDLRLHGGRLAGESRSTRLVHAPGAAAPVERRDLSDAPLRQTGSYRIRLQLVTTDGIEVFL